MSKVYTPTLTYSFMRNKHDSQSKKKTKKPNPTEIFTPSVIMAEVSIGEEKKYILCSMQPQSVVKCLFWLIRSACHYCI